MNSKQVIALSIAIVVVGGIVILFLKNFSPAPVSTDGRMQVTATIFPLADIARAVGGDAIDVAVILPPGASPHTFEARPSDLQKLERSSVLFMIGYGLDDWIADLVGGDQGLTVAQVEDNIRVASFTFGDVHEDHEHGDEAHEEHDVEEYAHGESILMDHDEDAHDHEGGADPHYWLSPRNAKIIAENIANTLVEIDPDREATYRANARAYQQELDALHDELAGVLSLSSAPELIVFHDSWGYFAREYGLEIAGVFEPSPGKEPTPQYLKELNDAAREHGATVVFTEPQLASGAVEPFVQDLGLRVYVLDPLGGVEGRDSYVDLMRYNAHTIRDAFSN